MSDKVYTVQDYKSGQPRWCPGCGDHAFLNSLHKAMAELGVAPHNIAVISGIGCSSRLPYYVNTYGFHTIHGRAAAVATGAKVANPNLTIWQISGDGDGLAIGGNHFIHAVRRNIDLNMILLNNRIYGLTKGQYSPTSERGFVSKSSPYGTVEDPFHPAELAFGARGRFFARCIAVDGAASVEVLKAAANHKGASVVEVLQNCVIFNDGTHASVATKEGRGEKHIVEKTIVELEEKLNITDCTEELKFTPKDILLKRDIDFINKIKLDKEYQEKTKTWKDYTREEKADLIMRYVEDIELTLVGNEVSLKQINFRDSICKPCQELYDKGYIDITKPMILGNVLGSVRFSNYLPDEEVCEIIMRLQQYYDVHFTEATYYLQKQMFYFNFAEDNSAIVRVFPLEDYYKLDPNNKMEKYRFGILYINEEDKFEMQDIDTAFDYIPDESNDSAIYMKEPVPISVGVKPVKFCEDNTEEKN